MMCDDCIDKMLLEFLEDAQCAIKNGEEIIPLAIPLILKNDGEVVTSEPLPIISLEGEEATVESIYMDIGIHCRELEAFGVVLGMDACARHIPLENAEYFYDNLETEAPDVYPKSMRENYMIIQYVDFINVERCRTITSRYDVDKDEKITFRKHEKIEGLLDNIVGEVVEGWNVWDEKINNSDNI